MPPISGNVELRVGMTLGQARAAVAAVWPHVVLRLYNGSSSYYKEGVPYAEDALTDDADLLQPLGGHCADGRAVTDPVVLTGTATTRQLRDSIHGVFGLEPQFEYIWPKLPEGAMPLDQMQAVAERYRMAFIQKHGRPPGARDDLRGVVPKS